MAASALVVLLLAAISLLVLHIRSADPGRTWQPAGLQGTLVHALALGPSGLPGFVGAQGGVYVRERTGSWRRVLASGEVWDLHVLPGGTTLIAAENAGTVAVSTDRGMHWRRSMVSPGGVYAVTARPGHPGVLLAGADGGLFVSADGGRHWRHTLRLSNAAGDALAWSPGSSNTVYAGTVSGGPAAGQQVYVSHDAGATWSVFGSHLQSTGGVMSLLVTRGGVVLAGTMGNAGWTTRVGRAVWRKTAQGMPPTGDHVAGMALLPGTPERAILGTLGHGLFVGMPGTNSWLDVSGSLHDAIVLSVVYSPRRHTVYAGTYQGIYALPISALPAAGQMGRPVAAP